MGLKETIDLMCSDDYKERFKAEYYQTKIRYLALKKILNRWDAYNESHNGNVFGVTLAKFLGFEPKCSYSILRDQQRCMGEYLRCLEIRAEIEDIEL